MKCFAAVIFVLAIMLISPAQSAVDLGELYRVAVNGAATIQGCGQRQMKNVQKHLEDQSSVAKMCADESGEEAKECYTMTVNLVKIFFSNMKRNSGRCPDASFLSMLTKYGSPIAKIPTDQLIESLKLFAHDASFSFIQLHKDLSDGLTQAAGCSRMEMESCQTAMASQHQASQMCAKYRRQATADMCFKGIVKDIHAIFMNVDDELEAAQCSDPTFDSIRKRVRAAFEIYDEELLDAIKAFSQTPLVEKAVTPDTTPAPAAAPTSIPVVTAPIQPKLKIDFTKTLISLTNGLEKAGCFKPDMEKTRNEMRKYQTMASGCLPNNITCFKEIGSKIKSLFSEFEEEVQSTRSSNYIVNDILLAFRNGLQACSDDDLINSVKSFGKTPIA